MQIVIDTNNLLHDLFLILILLLAVYTYTNGISPVLTAFVELYKRQRNKPKRRRTVGNKEDAIPITPTDITNSPGRSSPTHNGLSIDVNSTPSNEAHLQHYGKLK